MSHSMTTFSISEPARMAANAGMVPWLDIVVRGSENSMGIALFFHQYDQIDAMIAALEELKTLWEAKLDGDKEIIP